jgi:predicted nucleic acid-binding protein
MKAAVLADTGPLYALADPSDQYHKRAAAELETISKRDLSIAINYLTLCEAHALVLRRLGGEYSREWLREVMDGSALLSPEPGDFLLAAAQLEQFSDHPITLVDSVTAVMSRRLAIAVWSFDRHFTTMRTGIWR